MSLIHWLVTTIAILIASQIVPGIHVTILAAVILAVVLAIINMFVKPVLLILTLPLNILTLGLFSLVINAGLIMLAAMIVPNFAVDGFVPALLFSIAVSLVRMVLRVLEPKQ